MSYRAFLDSKIQYGADEGFAPTWFPPSMFDFQQSVTDWSIRKGRAADLLDCGMGKSVCELTYGENVVRYSNKPVLLLTPLAVGDQMVDEAHKFGIDAVRSKDGKFKGKRVVVSNYERLHYFNPHD